MVIDDNRVEDTREEAERLKQLRKEIKNIGTNVKEDAHETTVDKENEEHPRE